jgi:hypothetical protein
VLPAPIGHEAGWAQSRSGRRAEETDLFPYRESNPGREARRYTDSVEIGGGTHPAFYLMGTVGSFLIDKAELYLHSKHAFMAYCLAY